MRTAPHRGFAGERSDTPDPCRGFSGHGKDAHGTTPIPAEGSPASDPTRPIPVDRGFIGHGKDAHGTTPIFGEGSPASDPTRPIPVEGSAATARMRTAPHRSPQRVRRRAIRHARSPQRVCRRAQGFARHHSESAPTRPIPVEGLSATARIRMGTAPQRERADTPDPCRGFIGPRQGWARHHSESAPTRPILVEGSSATLKDAHGTTARALRHARSL